MSITMSNPNSISTRHLLGILVANWLSEVDLLGILVANWLPEVANRLPQAQDDHLLGILVANWLPQAHNRPPKASLIENTLGKCLFFLRDHSSCVFSSNIGPPKPQSSKLGSRRREFDRET